jgi:hypothetical protein
MAAEYKRGKGIMEYWNEGFLGPGKLEITTSAGL